MVRGIDKGQKAALIVNEMQRGVVEDSLYRGLIDEVNRKGIVPKIALLVASFRAKGLPVVHSHVVHRPDYADVLPNTMIMSLGHRTRGMVRGTREVESIDALAPIESDFVLERPFGLGSFYGTGLDSLLRRLKVDTLVCVGVSANVALSGLTLGGTDRGYQVILPRDCMAGATPDAEEQMIENQFKMLATITTSEDVIAAL